MFSQKHKQDYVPALKYHRPTRFYDPVIAQTVRERTFRHKLVHQASLEPGHNVLDGFVTTRDNIESRLPGFCEEAGFDAITWHADVNTVFGTLSLFSARKPAV